MSMKAQINTDAYGNIIVHVRGGLDFESTGPLRDELEELAQTNPHCAITIDMHNLDFVGSSGIGHFVETLKILQNNGKNIKLSNVKTEFLKVFKLYNLDPMDSMLEAFDNDDTENLNSTFGNRRKTFEV